MTRHRRPDVCAVPRVHGLRDLDRTGPEVCRPRFGNRGDERLQNSSNDGNSFTQLWPFGGTTPQHNPGNCINAIAIDDLSCRVRLTTMNDSTHIYRSSAGWTAAGPPGGMTWDLTTSGLPPG